MALENMAARPHVCESCAVANVAYELTPEAKQKERASMHPISSTPQAPHVMLRKWNVWGGVRPGAGICAACFAAAKYPSQFEAADFVSSSHDDPHPFHPDRITTGGRPWSTAEKESLLTCLKTMMTRCAPHAAAPASSMDMRTHDDHDARTKKTIDWNAVAVAVGRPPKECLEAFVQWPGLHQQERNRKPYKNHNRDRQRHHTADSYDSGHRAIQSRPDDTISCSTTTSAVQEMAHIIGMADASLVKAATKAVLETLDRMNDPQEQLVARVAGSDTEEKEVAQGMAKQSLRPEAEEAMKAVAVAAKAAGVHGRTINDDDDDNDTNESWHTIDKDEIASQLLSIRHTLNVCIYIYIFMPWPYLDFNNDALIYTIVKEESKSVVEQHTMAATAVAILAGRAHVRVFLYSIAVWYIYMYILIRRVNVSMFLDASMRIYIYTYK
jgi:hypothetical protein